MMEVRFLPIKSQRLTVKKCNTCRFNESPAKQNLNPSAVGHCIFLNPLQEL